MVLVKGSALIRRCRGKSLLGIDVGKTKIGLAYSDTDWLVAKADSIVKFDKGLDSVRHHITMKTKEFDIGGIVFGWPLMLDGSSGIQCKLVLRVLMDLDLKLPTTIWDERFTSVVTREKYFYEDFLGRNRGIKVAYDHLAAAEILEDFMRATRDDKRDVDYCFNSPGPIDM